MRVAVLAAFITFALPLAGCASMPDAAVQAEPAVRTVSVAGSEGQAGALLATPAGVGQYPAVILYPDASGLRPVFGDLARQIAARGYVVLVPNQFYRSIALDGTAATAAPALPAAEAMQRGMGWRQLATDEAVIADARALAAFLDAQPQVDRSKPMAVLGTDIGGAHAFMAARALLQRVAAVATAHPSAIATARDTSPHLFVGQSRAQYLIQIAEPDDTREPDDKTDLRTAFAAAGLTAEITVVPAGHGFAVADNPLYDPARAAAFVDAALALLDARLN